jgi:glycosyltransferase involved in cell wall biosynthesis
MAAVVIGRNEGKALEASLSSVTGADLPLVYVDSGSTDGSVALAEVRGVPVHELNAARPFSAARAHRRIGGGTALVAGP